MGLVGIELDKKGLQRRLLDRIGISLRQSSNLIIARKRKKGMNGDDLKSFDQIRDYESLFLSFPSLQSSRGTGCSRALSYFPTFVVPQVQNLLNTSHHSGVSHRRQSHHITSHQQNRSAKSKKPRHHQAVKKSRQTPRCQPERKMSSSYSVW